MAGVAPAVRFAIFAAFFCCVSFFVSAAAADAHHNHHSDVAAVSPRDSSSGISSPLVHEVVIKASRLGRGKLYL